MAGFCRGAAVRFAPMPVAPPDMTIDAVLPQFLAEQRERLSPRTFRKYEEVVELLRHCLDGYAYQYLDGAERQRWEAEFEAREEAHFAGCSAPRRSPRISASFSITSWCAR